MYTTWNAILECSVWGPEVLYYLLEQGRLLAHTLDTWASQRVVKPQSGGEIALRMYEHQSHITLNHPTANLNPTGRQLHKKGWSRIKKYIFLY